MYKTLSHHLQHGQGKVRSLSPEAEEYERRKSAKFAVIGSVHKGKMVKGKVTKVLDYGAFVDVSGVTGFIHISQLRGPNVPINEILKVGATYDFKVTEVGLNKKGILCLRLTRAF